MLNVTYQLRNRLVATAAAAIIGATGFGLVGSASAVSSTVAGVGELRLGDSLSGASNNGAYALNIVSEDDAAAAGRLAGRSLVYRSGTDVPTGFDTGVPYSQAVANGWLLKDGGGSYLKNSGYGYYIGDVGNAAYQQAFVANVAAFARANGIDGVFIDDVLRDLKPLTGAYPAKYPSQAAWQAAQASFVAAVGPALQAQGFYVLVNAVGYTQGDGTSNDGSLDVSWWRQLGPSVSGLMEEYWQEVPTGSNALRASGTASWSQNWDGWQRLVGTAQSMGKDFVGVTYGSPGDTTSMMYGRASFLMDWDGVHGAYIWNPANNSDPWNSAWTADLGAPAGAKQQVGTGWLRRFANGVALINPSPSSAQTFALGGSYKTPSGSVVTSVTLQPTTAMILTGGSGGTAPTPTTTGSTTTAGSTTTTATTTTAPSTTTTTTTTATTTTTPTTPAPTTTSATTTTAAGSPRGGGHGGKKSRGIADTTRKASGGQKVVKGRRVPSARVSRTHAAPASKGVARRTFYVARAAVPARQLKPVARRRFFTSPRPVSLKPVAMRRFSVG